MKKALFALLLCLGCAPSSWAGAIYKPTKAVTTLVTGKSYMIYNAYTMNSALGRSDNRNWFISAEAGNTAIHVDANHTKPANFSTTDKGALWKVTQSGTGWTVESVLKPGYYINGTSLNTTSTVYTIDQTKITGTNASNASYTDLSDFVFVHNGGTYWNGNPESFATWSNEHPYQFYEYSETAVKMDTVTYNCYDESNQLLASVMKEYQDGTKYKPAAPALNYYTYQSGLATTDSTLLSANVTHTLIYKQTGTLPTPPFTVTTLPDNATEFPADAAWYNIRVAANTLAYLYYENGQSFMLLDSTTVGDKESPANEWCFTGNAIKGYRIYNRAAGTGKVLYSANPASDGNTGGSTYPVLTDLSTLATANTTWDFVSATNGTQKGNYAYQHGITANKLNNRNGKLAYWTTGQDGGSMVFITKVDSILPQDMPKFDCATHLFGQPNVKMMHKMHVTNSKAVISVEGLPEGLTWNAKRNLVEGKIATVGNYSYTAKATMGDLSVTQPVTIEVSDKLLSPTPMMGWLSWNSFEGNITADIVKQIADAFVSNGLDTCGYKYVCIDDLWQASARATDNSPVPNATKFPNGMKDVADYVHAKNLKFGIYSDAAGSTCGGAYGSYGKETIDANAYASWGVDLLKYDYCGAPQDSASAHTRYKTMGDALKATGRDIFFYICEWGYFKPQYWASQAGGLQWRTTDDSRDKFWFNDGISNHMGAIDGVLIMNKIPYFTNVNRFNDADMMMVGLHGKGKSSNAFGASGMTQTEYQSQFSMWCMLASPLTLSFDVRTISQEDLAILTNKEVIAIDQDPLCQQALLVATDAHNIQYYAKDLENGDMAVAMLNLGTTTANGSIDLDKVFLVKGKKYAVRDLWKKAYVDTTDVAVTSANIASHETKVFRLTPIAGTGVDVKAVSNTTFSISAAADGRDLQVNCKGREGYAKTVYVTDMNGRIVAKANGTASSFNIPVNKTKGMYLVNVVCCGNAQTTKVIF